MAKIDISKLVGDNKNYSKLDLSPPPIAPPQAQGGNYRIVVGDSLKASETSMGQLSRALDNFAGPMMRSYAQLTEINEQEAIKEFDAMTDDAKQELLNKGDELNKELRKMGFKPNTAIETQRSIGEIGSSKFMSDWSQHWDQQIVDLQEDGSQITSDMMAQQWGQFRADYIANDEKLQKNVFAKEGFINITNDLWKRNQGTYLTTADNYYDQKVKIPALAENIKTAWEQNPEDIGTWWDTHVKDFNKTELLDAIDHISKNATTLSDKIALQSFLTTASASKLSVGKSTFDKLSKMELGTTKLKEDISKLTDANEINQINLRVKRANEEYNKAQGELALKLQENKKLKNPRPESEILEEFRNEVADPDGRNLQPAAFQIFFGDIAAHIETLENKLETEIIEDLNQSKIKAANAYAEYTNSIASARARGEDVSGLIQEFETYLNTNPDKFDEALLSDGWKAFGGVDEDPTLKQVNSFTQRAIKYPVSTGLQQAVNAANEATGVEGISQYLFTKEATEDLKNLQGFQVDARSIELLQVNAQETLIDYSNDISQVIPSAVAQEIIAENKERIIGDEIPPDLIPVYNKRLRERVAERNEEFKQDLISIAKENQLAEQKANAEKAGMSPEQLLKFNKRIEAKDIETSLEEKYGNAYDLSFENGELRLKIDDGWWRDVYDDGDELPDNKLFNTFFVNRYLKANKLLTYVSPTSKKENAELAKRALEKSGQISRLGQSITSGEITIQGTDSPFSMNRTITRKMTIDEEIAKRQEFQNLLSIRGVQDMIENDLDLSGGIDLSGVPLIGTVNDPTIGALYGATNRIQTLPASYIHAIDDGTPITDFPKIQELADRLGVTATELVNNNRMILKRQGHVFPEDELQIQID